MLHRHRKRSTHCLRPLPHRICRFPPIPQYATAAGRCSSRRCRSAIGMTRERGVPILHPTCQNPSSTHARPPPPPAHARPPTRLLLRRGIVRSCHSTRDATNAVGHHRHPYVLLCDGVQEEEVTEHDPVQLPSPLHRPLLPQLRSLLTSHYSILFSSRLAAAGWGGDQRDGRLEEREKGLEKKRRRRGQAPDRVAHVRGGDLAAGGRERGGMRRRQCRRGRKAMCAMAVGIDMDPLFHFYPCHDMWVPGRLASQWVKDIT